MSMSFLAPLLAAQYPRLSLDVRPHKPARRTPAYVDVHRMVPLRHAGGCRNASTLREMPSHESPRFARA
jgi:hypothetical protein